MRPSFLKFALLLMLGSAVSGAHAQLYKWVDKDGKISYSDMPPPKDVKDAKQKNYTDNITGPSDDFPFVTRDAMKRNPVTLYANACGAPCDSARELLNTRGIPFTDRNPESDATALDALKEATGGQSVPALTIGMRVLRGFAEAEWHDALTNSGYPRTNPGVKPKPPAVPAATSPATTTSTPATAK